MTEITFETATITDTVKKAAEIAPSKVGAAFDQAAGIQLEVSPDADVKCIIRATNLDVFYMESLDCTSATGEATVWRLPSKVLAGVLSGLADTAGKNVTFKQDGTKIRISTGRFKASLNLIMAEYYPQWDAYDASVLTEVPNLGEKIGMVSWAAAKDSPPFNGIHFDGEYVMATDRYRLAVMPCSIDLPRPVTLPASIAAAVMKETEDLRIGLSENSFMVSPDEYTQLVTVIFDLPYPPARRMMDTVYTQSVKVGRHNLAERVSRATAMAGSDRAPIVKLFFGKGEIALFMSNDEIGTLGDVIEVPGQIPHDRVEITYTPKNLTDALRSAPGDVVTIEYDPEVPLRKPTKIAGAQGYEAYIVPRRPEAVSV